MTGMDDTAPTLAEFVEARLDEDEATARALHGVPLSVYLEGGDDGWAVEGDPGPGLEMVAAILGDKEFAEHVARHDPARVLAEVAAKRAIVDAYREVRSRRDIYQSAEMRAVEDAEQAARRRSAAARCRGLEIAVELLAGAYADHPDYRQEWKP